MSRRKYKLQIPVIRALYKLGQDINHARRRRRITMALMAERAGISRSTLGKIEKGDPATSIGSYAAVLFALGMINSLYDIVDAKNDLVGRDLEDDRLPQRIRLPRQSEWPKRDDDNDES